ncbi:PspC domain-containing protein [Acinetobacter rudis]|uniref:PspC domain-containing protein n=1 Tax=Acinetobacter rudis TaxID=632955 RepID=A0AAW8JBZ8_9GAMM|nr:PspC domain-containing protein [Acinetobacter rudis]MDQ8937208.1 PspC domain-containing protein [Acinetobacter rudis]MDQ8953731.1 PspC domain-containing protein [Acinetobacter rudis]MDQ9019421.1 PspC domain-containing protein [Acinetobacter rudis]
MAQSGLSRSNQQRMIAGVMGGIAERFGWNANLLRILFVSISILSAGFPGILIYLILWFVIPAAQPQLNPSPSQRPTQMRTVYEDNKFKR